uniref:Interleukin-1 n=1 Tax=Leptobrachium leishanense TaxID=445787 RepID=A0A8C5M3E3_9ANUR
RLRCSLHICIAFFPQDRPGRIPGNRPRTLRSLGLVVPTILTSSSHRGQGDSTNNIHQTEININLYCVIESDLEDHSLCEAADVGEENFRYKVLRSRECAIRDCAQKCFVLQQSLGRDNLVARFLQNQNLQSEEKISMSLYASQNLNAGNKRLATLRLLGKNLYMSCSRVEGDPCLLVETVDDIKELQNDALKLFFFLTADNAHVFRFESVACPGWYIGTSQTYQERKFQNGIIHD